MVAKAASTSTTTVQRWRRPKAKGGTDGYIPRRHHKALIEHSRRVGVRLELVSFVDAAVVARACKSTKRRT